MFTLAHFTDPHIGPLPETSWQELMGKRLSGYLSWTKNRHRIHKMDILSALVADMQAQNPDHIALTGDIINISLKQEFINAAHWLKTVAGPENMSLVPGNHDAYTYVPYKKGLGLWSDYMTGSADSSQYLNNPKHRFPFLRVFGKTALIGVSSAVVTPPFVAGGRVGTGQLARLENLLAALGKDGFFRIIMIHHPPLPGQNSRRKGLWDAASFASIIGKTGAELILHGHNHKYMLSMFEGASGPVPVIGGPSASTISTSFRRDAGYCLFDIEKTDGKWRCENRIRKPATTGDCFVDAEPLFHSITYT